MSLAKLTVKGGSEELHYVIQNFPDNTSQVATVVATELPIPEALTPVYTVLKEPFELDLTNKVYEVRNY